MEVDVTWPADMIDADRLHELLGYKVGDRSAIGEEAYDRVRNLEMAIDHARLVGRIKRFQAKDRTTGDVIAYAYKRADIQRIMSNGG